MARKPRRPAQLKRAVGRVEPLGSVVGVALVAQVHRLLQRLAGLLSLFAHDGHVLVIRRKSLIRAVPAHTDVR